MNVSQMISDMGGISQSISFGLFRLTTPIMAFSDTLPMITLVNWEVLCGPSPLFPRQFLCHSVKRNGIE